MHATLSATGTVTFADAPVIVSKDDVAAMLADAQAHARTLAAFDRELERSKEYLTKVRRLLHKSTTVR